jgi:hypothetical protein
VTLSCDRTEKVKRAVEWIKVRVSPDNGNSRRQYAETVHSAFDEIKALRAERIGLSVIAKGFESEGMLPKNPDPNTLGRALKREERRRAARQASNYGNAAKKGPDIRKPFVREAAQIDTKREPFPARSEDGKEIQIRTVSGKAGLQINPDNTFSIRPIDPDDLPEI